MTHKSRMMTMNWKKALIAVFILHSLATLSCAYIVFPEEIEQHDNTTSEGWSATVTCVSASPAGDLHIDLTLRNETGDWSAMHSLDGQPAVLDANGGSSNCDTVFVSTGGHRVAPGFHLRGYIAGIKSEPEVQLVFVECEGAEATPGSTLSIEYSYVTGQYNYYEQDKTKVDDRMEIDLDEVIPDLVYPIAEDGAVSILTPEAEIVAINKVVLTLQDVQRTEGGWQFTWQAQNPGEYPTYVHIGNPPVIGEDGILYGYYETPDIVSVPIIPAADNAAWTTDVAVPEDVNGFYILLSVETGKARLFTNYAIDITDQ
jgi:hypothetical protein